jgi:uncharacterized repeat protein (TIGR01451 family)
MKLRRTVLGLTAAVVIVLVGATQQASAKSVSQVPASCSAGTAGYGVFLQAGSLVTVGFGASGLSSAGTWHVLIAEAGNPPIIDYTSSMGQQWTVSTNRTMPSGLHVVSVNVNNLVTGETCTSGFQFLVGGGGGGAATAQPDLQVTGSASTGTPAAGAELIYTFQIKNSGTAAANGVVFTDVLPVELGASFRSFNHVFVTAPVFRDVCTATNFDPDPLTIACDLGTLVAGSQVTITLSVNAPVTPGTFINTGTATTTDVDKNLANNDKTISVTVR